MDNSLAASGKQKGQLSRTFGDTYLKTQLNLKKSKLGIVNSKDRLRSSTPTCIERAKLSEENDYMRKHVADLKLQNKKMQERMMALKSRSHIKRSHISKPKKESKVSQKFQETPISSLPLSDELENEKLSQMEKKLNHLRREKEQKVREIQALNHKSKYIEEAQRFAREMDQLKKNARLQEQKKLQKQKERVIRDREETKEKLLSATSQYFKERALKANQTKQEKEQIKQIIEEERIVELELNRQRKLMIEMEKEEFKRLKLEEQMQDKAKHEEEQKIREVIEAERLQKIEEKLKKLEKLEKKYLILLKNSESQKNEALNSFESLTKYSPSSIENKQKQNRHEKITIVSFEAEDQIHSVQQVEYLELNKKSSDVIEVNHFEDISDQIITPPSQNRYEDEREIERYQQEIENRIASHQ